MSFRRKRVTLMLCIPGVLVGVSDTLSEDEFKPNGCVWEWVNGVLAEKCPLEGVASGTGTTPNGPFPGTNALRPNELVQDMIESGKFTNEQILILEGFKLKAY